MRTRRILPILFLAGASGCISTPVKAPPLQRVSLAGRTTEYRDYRSADVCLSEPLWLIDELRSVNRALEVWTTLTELPDGKRPSYEQQEAIEEGKEQIPALVAAYEPTIEKVSGCGGGFVSQLKEAPAEGRRLIALARTRLEEVPRKLAALDHQEALAKWLEALEGKKSQARATWCASSAPSLDIYFAYEGEDRATRWLFCDGTEVARLEGEAPGFSKKPPAPVVPARGRGRKKPPPPPAPEKYLSTAASYPEKEISRAPRPSSTP
jgi:hypothetical protein